MKNQNFVGVTFDRKKIGLIFLGVGITMFLMNMLTIISLLPYIEMIRTIYGNALTGYYVSVISSIILIVYSMYNIFLD